MCWRVVDRSRTIVLPKPKPPISILTMRAGAGNKDAGRRYDAMLGDVS